MEPLSRTSWKVKAEPTRRAPLGFQTSYNAQDLQQIRAGLLPEAMEDKWFIFSEGEWTYFCRSWTGTFVYGLRLEMQGDQACVAESWVNRDPEEYTGTDTEYDRALLKFLIDAFLLRGPATFPVPPGVNESAPGVYQHAAVGRAYPESAYVRSGWWNRILRALGFRAHD